MTKSQTAGEKQEKSTGRVNARFDIRLRELTDEMISLHNAEDVSEYLRGLVIYDAFANGKLKPGIAIPGWITDRILKMK